MDIALITQELNALAVSIAMLTLPALMVAALAGLIVATLQAVTQIQDQSLPQIIKIVAVGVLLMSGLGVLSMPIVSQTRRLFENIPTLAF